MANQCNPGYQVEGNRCVPKQNTLGNVQRSTNFNNSKDFSSLSSFSMS